MPQHGVLVGRYASPRACDGKEAPGTVRGSIICINTLRSPPAQPLRSTSSWCTELPIHSRRKALRPSPSVYSHRCSVQVAHRKGASNAHEKRVPEASGLRRSSRLKIRWGDGERCAHRQSAADQLTFRRRDELRRFTRRLSYAYDTHCQAGLASTVVRRQRSRHDTAPHQSLEAVRHASSA